MANVTIDGFLLLSDGTQINLSTASVAEGTETSITTNTTYSVTAMNVGDFAPNALVVGSQIQAPNGIAYAYILRNGTVATVLSPFVKGAADTSAVPLCAGFRLQAGDIVRVMANTASDREAAISCYLSDGSYRIFAVTPSGGATNTPTDILSGLGAGDSMQGRTITKVFCTSVDGSKISGGGALMLNEKGVPVGTAVACNSPIVAPVQWANVSIPVHLNYAWSIVTSS